MYVNMHISNVDGSAGEIAVKKDEVLNLISFIKEHKLSTRYLFESLVSDDYYPPAEHIRIDKLNLGFVIGDDTYIE